MDYLIDANCLLRLIEKNSPHRKIVLRWLELHWRSGNSIFYTPQILSEFWNVCTRPTSARGGFGLSIEQTERKVKLIEKHFQLLPDNKQTFTQWRTLVFEHRIKGVQVHDAKIVASMMTHNISHLLTFNVSDFSRFTDIIVVNPADAA